MKELNELMDKAIKMLDKYKIEEDVDKHMRILYGLIITLIRGQMDICENLKEGLASLKEE